MILKGLLIKILDLERLELMYNRFWQPYLRSGLAQNTNF